MDNPLFEKKHIYSIHLLKCLYGKQEFVLIEDLATKLKINRKSITQYLNNIQSIISQSKKLNDDILQIQNRQGAYFSGTPFEYNYICNQILKSSLTFEILETLFFKKEPSLIAFCQNNFVTDSTVRLKIKKINLFAEKQNIHIYISKGLIKISGEESQIRYFSYILFWKFFKGIEWPFSQLEEVKIQESAINILSKLNIPATKISVQSLMYIIAINISRSRSHFPVESDFGYFLMPDLPIVDSSIYNLIEHELGLSRPLPEIELRYLTIQLLGYPQFYLYSDMFSKLQAYLKSSTSPISKMHKKAIKLFNTSIDWTLLSIEEKQISEATIVAALVSSFLFPNFSFNSLGTYSGNVLRQHVPKLMDKMDIYINQIVEDIPFPFNKNYLVAHLTEAYCYVQNYIDVEKCICFTLESDFDFITHQLLVKKIKQFLNLFFNVKYVENYSSEPDFVIQIIELNKNRKQDIPTFVMKKPIKINEFSLLLNWVQTNFPSQIQH
ncbi:helix-turn-helix domain-containing protein [Enterococcus faecalis]|uniref:helix-turn-helix domain-containing protein n=2 Tax=Enterococcus faecalis TaxID=1351 RepID=UPI0020108FFD|nr:helix-turn-helix domain-containing protein [Enterococcus faecalis]MCU2256758.1 helix-turn-helix domain-containing protein [Enterococcus faecalis]UQF57309.1 helix-turn-helix domain-containing protein [Enterococcus faecalis]